ncbi:AMMECR1 domain-containing protein [Podospora appendiculata]|uniref:AMMECR1 domain-containing protein n=1 Tax=Podospora appendiculata TaxID=314037 RepID=A0AAE1CDV4_9PEZI|nr:AMMECR1 domain-containing protein [Podospora appendiculata]
MATIEHCLYCFEALAAHLENRKAMTLSEVEKSFAEYTKTLDAAASSDDDETTIHGSLAKRLPALRRLAATSTSTSSSSSSSSSIGDSSSSLPLTTPSSTSSTTSLQPPSLLSSDAADTPATSICPTPPPPITASPLFVTWNTVTPRQGTNLRGCIGTFEAQPLSTGLSSYALTSALHDTRFSPVSARELPTLEVAVTLLTDFEDAADAMDWDLGTHGIRISFTYHGRRYGATYLPDVAVEQGWTKEETLVSLMRKAGWMGRKDKWAEVELKVVRYQGKRESLGYGEYKKWRDWVERGKGK